MKQNLPDTHRPQQEVVHQDPIGSVKVIENEAGTQRIKITDSATFKHKQIAR